MPRVRGSGSTASRAGLTFGSARVAGVSRPALGRLTTGHVHTTAQCLEVSERTVWRWLTDATTTPAAIVSPGARDSDRFEITPDIRVLLAYWRGNASVVHTVSGRSSGSR
ncbi:hypothetical protein ACWGR4_47865 [Embleya sp. NPDC055664]